VLYIYAFLQVFSYFSLSLTLWPTSKLLDARVGLFSFIFQIYSLKNLELDRVLGDILTNVMEKEMEIMVKLIQFVEKKIHCLDNILDLLAEFDA